jgi:hypothetical protein
MDEVWVFKLIFNYITNAKMSFTFARSSVNFNPYAGYLVRWEGGSTPHTGE